MITEDYVNFETAKLLKEKGFEEGCRQYWYKGNIVFSRNEIRNGELDNYEDKGWTAPTLQMVMKWLREKHIIIDVTPLWFHADGKCVGWTFNLWADDNLEVDAESHSYLLSTYEEAGETAIKYCLENLI